MEILAEQVPLQAAKAIREAMANAYIGRADEYSLERILAAAALNAWPEKAHVNQHAVILRLDIEPNPPA